MRYTLGYAEKLHLQNDFQRVFKSGRRFAHPAIFIYTYPRADSSPLRRLGLVTSRKLGNAVTRNRLKRRLREIFRLNKYRLAPGTDVIFVPRPAATKLEYPQLESVVFALWEKAGVLRKNDAGATSTGSFDAQ